MVVSVFLNIQGLPKITAKRLLANLENIERVEFLGRSRE